MDKASQVTTAVVGQKAPWQIRLQIIGYEILDRQDSFG